VVPLDEVLEDDDVLDDDDGAALWIRAAFARL
jgi:hypothetical protein